MITGSIRCDLTEVPEDRHKHRVYGALQGAPDGARVILLVGALAVSADGLRFLLEHVERLDFDVQGEVLAVRRWVEALRTGNIPGVLI